MWPFKEEEKPVDKAGGATLTVRYRSGRQTNHYAGGGDPGVFSSVYKWWASEEKTLVVMFDNGDFFCLCRDDIESMYVNS